MKQKLQDHQLPFRDYEKISTTTKKLKMISRGLNIKTLLFLMGMISTFMIYFINYKLVNAYMTKYLYDRNWYIFQVVPCSQSKEYLNKLTHLATDASLALTQLGVPSVACYGTLLGALRRGNVLPWDNNIDLCVVNRIPKDFNEIEKVFLSFDIIISPYDSFKGNFFLHRGSVYGHITVFGDCTILDDVKLWWQSDGYNQYDDELVNDDKESVGYNDEDYYLTEEEPMLSDGYNPNDVENDLNDKNDDFSNNMNSDFSTISTTENSLLKDIETSTVDVKQEHWLCHDGSLPYITQLIRGHTKPIPARYLRAPFPSLPFGKNESIPIPNGDADILKYFYPYSWWVEVKPQSCN